MRLVWGADDLIGKMISANFPDLTANSPYVPHAAVGIANDEDEIVGGVGIRLLNAFDGSISVYMMGGGTFTRPMLRDLFRRAFYDIGLVRLSCTVAKNNKRSRRLVERVGFRLEGTKRQGYDGARDACLYGMLFSECKWIGERDGFARSTRPDKGRPGANGHEYRYLDGVERPQ